MTTAGRAQTGLAIAAGVIAIVGLTVAGVLPVLVLVASLPFLLIVATRPVLRRLALRNAARRPKESALVLLGAMFGTAIITGSAIVGDTLEESSRALARTQLGPADIVAVAFDNDAATRAHQEISSLASSDDRIDGVMRMSGVVAPISATADGGARAEPRGNVLEIDFAEARTFGGRPEDTGVKGTTPAAGEAVITDDLADTLRIGEGDTVSVHAFGTSRDFRVTSILGRHGIAGFTLFSGSNSDGPPRSQSPNVFLTPGTLDAWPRASADARPPQQMTLVSLRGGVYDSAPLSEPVAETMRERIGPGVSVDTAKADGLRIAELVGASFTELFGSLGVFTSFAGVLLLVNIFVMLAQERRTEMGMMRAVGMRRRALVGSFGTEGWLYALGAAALGTIGGLGVGYLIVLVTASIFRRGNEAFEMYFSASAATLRFGFSAGFLISLVTVVATSFWVSRQNVIRAIRDLPEPTTVKRRLISSIIGAIAVVLGIVMTMSGFANSDAAAVLAGPLLIALGGMPLLSRFAPRRLVVSLLSGALLVWAIAAFDIAGDAFRNPDISLFVVDGIILVIAAITLISQNQDVIGSLIRRLGGGRAMSARLGLAYPLSKRGRTGLILAMYSVVAFSLTGITLFAQVFENQIDNFTADVSGGFDVKVRSLASAPIAPDALATVPGVEAVAPVVLGGAEFDAGRGEFTRWPIAGFDERLVDRGAPALQEWMPELGSTEEDAYRAVLANPEYIIVNEFFLVEGAGGPPPAGPPLGMVVKVRNIETGVDETVTVVALSEAGFDNAFAWRAAPAVEQLLGERASATLSYVAVSPDADAQDVAERINGEFLTQGADAISFERSVAQGLEFQQSFMRLMQGYLALGLVVAIAGLGVVMVRAVRERRREVGVLRALGFQPKAIRRAFIIESGFVAVEGVVVGTVLAIITVWRLIGANSFGDGLEFSVPWLSLLLLIALTLAASLLATVAPAQQASRIKPAVALRIAD
jgi:putative ABC transport system permease protein